ncbi:MAG: peptidase [Candidatus Micrarchaeota archaeon]|nr:MAG: peptidase [Candidatus Micrarchaeota archaeon]
MNLDDRSVIKSAYIENRLVRYKVLRRKVRYARIDLTNGELVIVLPYRAKDEIKIINKHSRWIVRTLDQINEAKAIAERYRANSSIMLFGKEFKIEHSESFFVNHLLNTIYIDQYNKKHLTLFYRFIRKELLKALNAICNIYSNELSVRYNKIYIRNQRTRWGSCSSKGSLSFNIRLAFIPKELLKYVVYHEVLHIKIKAHNREFFKCMRDRFSNIDELDKLLTTYWFLTNLDTFPYNILKRHHR